MERRLFLQLGGAAAVLAACGGGASSSTASNGNPDLVVVPNDWDFFSGTPYRLAVLLASNKNNGAPLSLTSPVTLRVGPDQQALGPPIATVIHANGPEPAYALTTYTFPKPGVYTLEATYQGKSASLPITVTATSASETPVVGAHMISVQTPTVANPAGVKPVCTQVPPCPFHQVSLDAALKAHKPVALLFATPALCQSRYCGPVLLNLTAVSAPWRSAVTFVHCEIYTDLSGQTTTHPVDVWGLQHEPMLYLGDTHGVIKARIDNLFDKDEAGAALRGAYGPGVS